MVRYLSFGLVFLCADFLLHQVNWGSYIYLLPLWVWAYTWQKEAGNWLVWVGISSVLYGLLMGYNPGALAAAWGVTIVLNHVLGAKLGTGFWLKSLQFVNIWLLSLLIAGVQTSVTSYLVALGLNLLALLGLQFLAWGRTKQHYLN